MAAELPQLHPLIYDRIESERCPDCGEPGVPIRRLNALLIEWACPACEPDKIGKPARGEGQ